MVLVNFTSCNRRAKQSNCTGLGIFLDLLSADLASAESVLVLGLYSRHGVVLAVQLLALLLWVPASFLESMSVAWFRLRLPAVE